MAAATQTESQIISSSLIRDDRETRKTKRRREREREETRKKTYENKNDKKKKKKKERREKRIIQLFIVMLVNTRQRKLMQFRANKRIMRHPINSTFAYRYLSDFFQIY